MRTIYIFLGLCVSLLLFSACQPADPHKILVVHSYEDDYALYPEFNKQIAKEFSKRNVPVDIRTFYLNCEMHTEKKEIEKISNYLDSLQDWKPDVILVNEDQATYSLLKTSHSLVKHTPVVFSGVNYPNWELIKQYPNVTGFHDKIDIVTNLRMINQLTHNYHIYTVLDYTFLDRMIRADIDTQLTGTDIVSNLDWHLERKGLEDKIKEERIVLSALSVRRPSANWAVNPSAGGADFLWNVSKYSQAPYLQTKLDYTTQTMASFSTRNRFTAINELFDCGYNFLGGYMTSLHTQIEEQIGTAMRILQGTDISQLPIQESAKDYYIDWNVMQKEGLEFTDIPVGYNIINVPFKVKHPAWWWIFATGSSLALVALLILLTYLYWREHQRKRQVLYDLEDERESLALAVEGSDTYAWQIKDNHIIFEQTFWRAQDMEPQMLKIEDFLSFVHPDYLAEVEPLLKKTAINGKNIIKIQCDFNGMGYQWWELRCSTMQSILGGQKTTGLLLNIEEYKRREQELIEARQLAEKAELKESFLANMSHEIRTPLNAIVGFSNLLASPEMELDQEDKDQFVESINHNSQILLKLINDILELSRIESGYMSFSYADCEIASLVDNVYRTHQLLIPGKIDFIKEEGEPDLWVYADKERLIQVLTNLINNANKFTPEGHIKVGWRFLTEEEKVEIYVEDSGIGIPQPEQKIIFQRFYKQNEFAQGTGLGLSICKVIVEKLRGSLLLWSEPGKGSRFSVCLPCFRKAPSDKAFSSESVY